MMTAKKTWLIALASGTALVLIAWCLSRQARTQAGPANHGLRLHLSIASTRTGDQDSHLVSLSIINTGPDPITLTATFPYGPEPSQTYIDSLAGSTSFSSQPRLRSEPFQSAGGDSGLPQPTTRLAAGATADAQWTVTDSTFTSYYTNQSLTLPMDGLYLLRAHLTVRTSDNQFIDLWSNEAPCSIGGSIEAPRKCSPIITKVAADRAITIRVGAQHGVKLGDQYLAVLDPLSNLKDDVRRVSLRVTAVAEHSCTAVAEPGGKLSGYNGAMPWFPEPGLQVFLQSPEKPRRPTLTPTVLTSPWPE